MRIVKPHEDFLPNQQIKEDLLNLLAQPSPAEVPPCPSCTLHTQKTCSSQCEEAPEQLSVDAVNYPLERGVVPLVFELAATRLIQPCWSCEGHLNPEDELWKIPQISFYSASPVYPQLLLRHIAVLERQKRLTYPWHVVLSDFGQTWGITYTLEPNLNYHQTRNVSLSLLQSDLKILAEKLSDKLKAQAHVMLAELPETTIQASSQQHG